MENVLMGWAPESLRALQQEMGAVTVELGSEVVMEMTGSRINRGIITMRIGLPGYPTEHHTGPLH